MKLRIGSTRSPLRTSGRSRGNFSGPRRSPRQSSVHSNPLLGSKSNSGASAAKGTAKRTRSSGGRKCFLFSRLRPIQMPMQKAKGALAIDRVRPIEELDFAAVANAQLIIEAPHLGVFVSDPFVGRDAVIVATLDHEGPRCDQRRHLRIVKRIAQIE